MQTKYIMAADDPQVRPLLLKIYTRLSQAAIRTGKDRLYRLWCVCRGLDREGRGWVTVTELCKMWPQNERTTKRLLAEGAGVWWTLAAGRVYLRSLERVCVAMNTEPGRAHVIPLEAVISIADFRSWCYAANFARPGGRRVSRGALQDRYGKSRQTLRTWEKKRAVVVQRNVKRLEKAAVCFGAEGRELPIARNRADFWESGGFFYWQAPNSYFADVPGAGYPKRTAKHVRYALSNEAGAATSRFQRAYWADASTAHKAAMKGKTPEVYFVFEAERGPDYAPRAIWRVFFADPGQNFTPTMRPISTEPPAETPREREALEREPGEREAPERLPQETEKSLEVAQDVAQGELELPGGTAGDKGYFGQDADWQETLKRRRLGRLEAVGCAAELEARRALLLEQAQGYVAMRAGVV